MKLYSTLLISFFTFLNVDAQNSATITLESNRKMPKDYYLNIQNKTYDFEDNDIAFEKSIAINGPQISYLIAKNGKLYPFWIEPGEIKLYFNQKLLKKELEVKGSQSNEIYSQLRSANSFEALKKIIASNRKEKPTLYYINSSIKFKEYNENQVKEIASLVDEEDRGKISDFIAFVKSYGERKLKKGEEIIDFTGIDENGKSYNTQDLRGKYLLIDVAATWCGPCWFAFPYMLQSLEKYEGEIQFITLNQDQDIKRWNKIADKNKLNIPWPVLWEVEGGKQQLLYQYQIEGYPTYILVDPKGKVVEKWSYTNKKVLKRKLAKHL